MISLSRRLPFLILCGWAAACLSQPAAAHNQLTQAERAAGWQLLFDGATLAHWRTYNKDAPDARWQIIDNAVVLTEGGGGDLISRGQYAAFELQLEWQITPGGNSGIFLLADESSLPIYVHATEIQILDNERHADGAAADRRSGSLYDLVAAPAASQRAAGAWNHVRIRHQQGHLQVWQNGVQSVDVHIGSAAWQALVADSKFADWTGFAANPGGHIGLQDHGDRVAFRNLKILPLDAAR